MVEQNRVIAGRYELTVPVGRGAMGEVWAGYDQRLDRRVAVKLLPSTKLVDSNDPQIAAQRFVREAKLTARVEHSGVPAVHDAGQDGDDLFLVMQLISGIDLGDLIAERGPLPVSWSAAVAAQIASVFASAHEASLVHRDLKPRNVIVANSGAVKVLDFGIAAVLDSNITKLTRTHETLGTPAYMAPEQAMSGKATPHSDLYSLGCVLHEMLSGMQVFTAALPLAVLHKHLDEPPTPLRQYNLDVPEPLEALVLDLLAKSPERRPRDAHELYRRLRPYLPTAEDSERAPESADPTAPYRYPHAPRPSSGQARSDAELPHDRSTTTEGSEERIRRDQERANELVEEGRFTQAAEILRSLLDDQSLADRLTEHRRLRIRQNLATFHFLGSDYRNALDVYTEVLTEMQAQPGVSDEAILDCRFMVANCRVELGEGTTAVAELRELIDEYENVLPEHYERLLEIRVLLAMLLSQTDEVAQARELFEHVLMAEGARYADPYVAQARHYVDRLDELGQ